MQVLTTAFGAFMVTGLTFEMNIKQELQCYTHYPFMSSDNWLNNTSFPFYKADKSHKSRCFRRGLRHAFHSGFCLAQQPAEHPLGSQLSWGERREECRRARGKQRREPGREEGPPHRRAAWQSCLPRWSRAGLFPCPPVPCPCSRQEAAGRPRSGARLGNVLYLISSQQPPPSGKLGVSLTPTSEPS